MHQKSYTMQTKNKTRQDKTRQYHISTRKIAGEDRMHLTSPPKKDETCVFGKVIVTLQPTKKKAADRKGLSLKRQPKRTTRQR